MNTHFLQRQNFALRRENEELHKTNTELMKEVLAYRVMLSNIKLTWWQRWKLTRVVKRAKAAHPPEARA